MTPNPSDSLSFRSYGAEGPVHSHDHAQIVLPVWGTLEIEVGGRGGCLDRSRAIFIAPGIRHTQAAEGANRFLILNCSISSIPEEVVDRLACHSFLNISGAVRSLIQFIDLSTPEDEISFSVVQHSLPLLLNTLFEAKVQRASRLAVLLRRIERSVGEDWPVSRMAQVSGLSASRLHALFQSELQTTPQSWLSKVRLRRAEEVLANSNLPICQLALQLGYSDQTAFTRAMRRMTQMTPATYRRLHRQ
jgi:AraC-like DNA-binding protein